MGWLLLLEYGIAGSTVAVGWSGYVVSFLKDFHIFIPPEWTAATGMHLINVPGEGWKQLTDGLAKALADKHIAVATLPAGKIPRANTAGETKGLLKAVVDRKTQQILGCSLFCHSAGEVMSVVQMAMIGQVPYTAVRDTIFTHPTMAESLNLLFAGL